MAALHGHQASAPLGDPAEAKKLLDSWPRKTSKLRKHYAARSKAVRWLQGTGYAMLRQRAKHRTPPRPKSERGYWNDNTGHVEVKSKSGTAIVVQFTIPDVLYVNGMWEIVLLDLQNQPPTVERSANIRQVASLLASAFSTLTGAYPGIRLVAPGYQKEAVITPLRQDLSVVITSYILSQGLPVYRPGAHCHEMRLKRRNKYEWSCPLRRSGECSPFEED